MFFPRKIQVSVNFETLVIHY